MPAYVDCDCDSLSADGPYSGSWDFWSEGIYGYLGSEWYSDLTWIFYAPSVSPAACTGDSCCSCLADNPTNEVLFFEYYAEYDESLEIWVY